MNTLEKRLATMEKAKKNRPMSKLEIDQQIVKGLAALGTNKEAVIAEYGSVGAFFYWRMCQISGDNTTEPTDGLTAGERYIAMLG